MQRGENSIRRNPELHGLGPKWSYKTKEVPGQVMPLVDLDLYMQAK